MTRVVITLALATLIGLAGWTPAADAAEKANPKALACGDLGCTEYKVNFGTAKIVCLERNQTMSSWVCEYELGYRCREEGGPTIKSGGFDPAESNICNHVCGKCPGGWK